MKSAACAAESGALALNDGVLGNIDRGMELASKQREVSQKIERLRNSIRLICSQGERVKGESSTSSVEVVESPDVLVRLLEQSTKMLQQIESALRRIEQGTYGICFDCEEPIPDERIKALPFAIRCKDCAEIHEQGKPRFGRSIRG